MATLIKSKEGIIYDEDFQTNPLIWSLTPSTVDCLRFKQDGLHILHNDKYVMYTMREPIQQDYCIIVELEHNPLTKEDIAGIIVFSNTQDYAECQTYLATGPSTIDNHGRNIDYDLGEKYVEYSYIDGSSINDGSTGGDSNTPPVEFVDTIYKYIKVVKHCHDVKSIYEFYASADGKEWIDVGNADYAQNNTIGFFLYSTNDENVLANGKFVIKSFRIYSAQDIVINGINILQEFEIYEKVLADPQNQQSLEKNTILRSDVLGSNQVVKNGSTATINTNSLLVPLQNAWIRIYQKDDYETTLYEYPLGYHTIGGDEFTITYDIKLFIDNQEIEKGALYNLQTLFTDTYRRNIIVYNNEDSLLQNVKVSIAAYSEYYSGEEVVKLALYNNTQEIVPSVNEFEYNDYVIIPSLPAHTGQEIIIKLSDVPSQDFYAVANDFRFKLLIE